MAYFGLCCSALTPLMSRNLLVYTPSTAVLQTRIHCCRYFHKSKKINEPTVAERDLQSQENLESVLDVLLQSHSRVMRRLSKTLGNQELLDRLKTLESVGCSINHIQAYPNILKLSESEIMERMHRLINLNVPVSVQLLEAASIKSSAKLKQRVAELACWNEYLCTSLECSPEEILRLQQKVPRLGLVANTSKVRQKLSILFEFGLSLNDLKSSPYLLIPSSKTMQERLMKVKQLQDSESISHVPARWLITSHAVFNRKINSGEKMVIRFNRHRSEIKSLLDVDDKFILSDKHLFKCSLHTVQKINYLLEVGIPKQQIINHAYLLSSSLKRLREAVERIRSAAIDPPSIIFLISQIHHHRLAHCSGKPRHQHFVASEIGMTPQDVKQLGSASKHLFSEDKITIIKNSEFLQSQGFALEDIRACPFVLAHNHETLTAYFQKLPHLPELQPFDSILADRGKHLNYLQYVIERDINFSNIHPQRDEESLAKQSHEPSSPPENSSALDENNIVLMKMGNYE